MGGRSPTSEGRVIAKPRFGRVPNFSLTWGWSVGVHDARLQLSARWIRGEKRR